MCPVAREQVCGDGIVSYQIACTRVGGLLTVLDLLGNTKVRDLDSTLVVDKHVSAFDVPVDDVALVEVVETEQDLADPIAHERLLERAIIP